MEERKLTEKESLDVITSMIARTRAKYLGSGNILLMWGYLIVIVTIAVWVLLATTRNEEWNWLFFAIPAIGIPATVTMAKKSRQNKGVTTCFDKITSRMWYLFAASEIALAIVCLAFDLFWGIDCWIAMLVYSILLVPATEIAQGLIFTENSLVYGGAAGLLVGIVTICCVAAGIPLIADWYMPLFILAWVCMMIIPGHIVNSKSKTR